MLKLSLKSWGENLRKNVLKIRKIEGLHVMTLPSPQGFTDADWIHCFQKLCLLKVKGQQMASNLLQQNSAGLALSALSGNSIWINRKMWTLCMSHLLHAFKILEILRWIISAWRPLVILNKGYRPKAAVRCFFFGTSNSNYLRSVLIHMTDGTK